MKAYYSISADECIESLNSNLNGISADEAKARLEQYGPNALKEDKKVSPILIFIKQFNNLFTLILALAIGVSLTITIIGRENRIPECVFIFLIIIINSVLGFIQNYKAEKGVQALKNMVVPKTTVIREGIKEEIDACNLVPGDIIELGEGDSVPADARLIDAHSLNADESAFTGESVPAHLKTDVLPEKTTLQDRKNMVFMGTYITQGAGKAVVVATGMHTELGKIATDLSAIKPRKTPFELEIDKLAKQITVAIAFIVSLVAVMTLLRGHMSWVDVLILCMGLFVGAIPEAMPAIVTFAMSLGTKRMAAEKALVRDLPVVASLGSVDIICSDKTGTLTENQMTVERVYFNEHELEFSGKGYHEDGEVTHVENKPIPMDELDMLLRCGLLCNNASIQSKGKDVKYIGDPTEIALLVSARKAGLNIAREKNVWARIDEMPFTSERERMTTIHKNKDFIVALSKGAPEVILASCNKVQENGEIKPLSDDLRKKILESNEDFAKDALRVLAFSYKKLDSEKIDEGAEKDQVFIGLQAMIDPPRSEVKAAIDMAHHAGIRTIMITGDNAVTAAAIGRQLDFGQRVITGGELSKIHRDVVISRVEALDIVSRALPQDKLMVAEAFEANGHVVAMTGDGVNDAPALKAADVGIAMGLRGTDVAKSASGMILLDDNYGTIIKAIKEGRTIYANIRKIVNYLLTCNLAEVFVIFIASILGFIPLTVIQILWINIVTDTTVAMAQATDPSNPKLMNEPPRPKKEGLIDNRLKLMVLSIGLAKVGVLFAVYYAGKAMGGEELGSSMLFTTIVLYSFVRISVIRVEEEIPIFINKWVNLAVLVSLCLQLLVIYTPVNTFFGVKPFGILEWVVMLSITGAAWFLGVGVTLLIKKFTKA